MGQYVARQNKIDYATVSNSLDRQISDLNTRREKQRSQMKMMAEAIAQKRKNGDTSYYNFKVDEYGGVDTTHDRKSNSYLDFFKTKNIELNKEKGENSITYQKVEDKAKYGNQLLNEYKNTDPILNVADNGTNTSNQSINNQSTNKQNKLPLNLNNISNNMPKRKTEEELRTTWENWKKEDPNFKTPFEDYMNKYNKSYDKAVEIANKINMNLNNNTNNNVNTNTNNLLPDEYYELDKGAKRDAGDTGNYSISYNGPSNQLSFDNKDLYIKTTKTSEGFNNNQVKADYNDLVANQMMSNSNSAWGHGSNSEIWKSLAEKAYEERANYNKALLSDSETKELIEMGGLKYSVGKSGGSIGKSISKNTENNVLGGKPKDVTFRLNNVNGTEHKAIQYNAQIIGANGAPLITPVVDIPGINLKEVFMNDPNIIDNFSKLKYDGWQILGAEGTSGLQDAINKGRDLDFINNNIRFTIKANGTLSGQVPSYILTKYGNINVSQGNN